MNRNYFFLRLAFFGAFFAAFFAAFFFLAMALSPYKWPQSRVTRAELM